MSRYPVSIAVAAALALGLSHGDEGRIPIYQPTTITQPGHYIVTRDIAVSSGVIVRIMATGVTVNLNGHTLSSTSMAENLIEGNPGPPDVAGVAIRNGQLVGGAEAIHCTPPNPIVIRLEGLKIAAAAERGIYVQGADVVEIRDTSVRAAGGFALEVAGTTTPTRAMITGSVLAGPGALRLSNAVGTVRDNIMMLPPNPILPPSPIVELLNAAGSLLEGNGISWDDGSFALPAVQLTGSTGVVLERNVIHGAGGTAANHGISVDATSFQAVVRGNSITRCGGNGIRLESSGAQVEGNLVNANGLAGTLAGIYAGGDNNALEANRVAFNSGAGIFFFNSSGHIYRDNILRANSGGAIAGPGSPDITDGGGNIP